MIWREGVVGNWDGLRVLIEVYGLRERRSVTVK